MYIYTGTFIYIHMYIYLHIYMFTYICILCVYIYQNLTHTLLLAGPFITDLLWRVCFSEISYKLNHTVDMFLLCDNFFQPYIFGSSFHCMHLPISPFLFINEIPFYRYRDIYYENTCLSYFWVLAYYELYYPRFSSKKN